MSVTKPLPTRLLTAFGGNRRGGVAVEFALIATILIVSLGGIVDLMTISTLNREIERSSTQIASTFTSCSRTTDSSCIPNTLAMYRDKTDNVLIRMPNATVSIAQIAEVSGALHLCAGNMTYLDSDVSTSALTLLNDKDTAIIVLIQTDYVALLPMITRVFTGQTTSHLRGWTTSVQSSGAPAC